MIIEGRRWPEFFEFEERRAAKVSVKLDLGEIGVDFGILKLGFMLGMKRGKELCRI